MLSVVKSHLLFECHLSFSVIASNYRPQRSWGKVIFSEECVKNSVHRLVSGQPPSPGSRHPLPQEADTPPQEQCMLGDTGNKQVVCILLGCILVFFLCFIQFDSYPFKLQ